MSKIKDKFKIIEFYKSSLAWLVKLDATKNAMIQTNRKIIQKKINQRIQSIEFDSNSRSSVMCVKSRCPVDFFSERENVIKKESLQKSTKQFVANYRIRC